MNVCLLSGARRHYSTETAFQEGADAPAAEREQKAPLTTQEEIESLKERLAKLEAKDKEAVIDAARFVSRELGMREKGRNCLRFRNIPLSTEETPEARKADDRAVMLKIVKDVLGLDIPVVDAYRIRVMGDPLVVRFRNEEDKNAVCEALIKMWSRDPETRRIQVGPFFTKMQFMEANEVINQRNEKAEAAGLGRPWYLSVFGQVVMRLPNRPMAENQ